MVVLFDCLFSLRDRVQPGIDGLVENSWGRRSERLQLGLECGQWGRWGSREVHEFDSLLSSD